MTPQTPSFLDRLKRFVQPVLDGLAQYGASLQEQAEVFRGLVPLGAHGWTISTYGVILALDAHRAAAGHAATDLEAADGTLEELWSDGELRRLVCSLVVYVYEPEDRELAERRRDLLLRAAERFDEGMYAEAVLLVYSQLDGLFADRAEAEGERAFAHLFKKYKPRDPEVRQFTDIVQASESMISTEHEFFLAVRELLSANVTETTLGDHPSRHGVLHGRVLGYDNRRRAAQAFAFLAGCIELLVASRDGVPMTRAEAHETPFSQAPPELRFLILTRSRSPVRGVYLSLRAAEQRRTMLIATRDTSSPGQSSNLAGPALESTSDGRTDGGAEPSTR